MICLIQYPINDSDWWIPRKLFSMNVSGQVIPNNASNVTRAINARWNILNLVFLIQVQPHLYPIGIRKNPVTIKTTIQRWTTKTISAINDIFLSQQKTKQNRKGLSRPHFLIFDSETGFFHSLLLFGVLVIVGTFELARNEATNTVKSPSWPNYSEVV